MSRSCQHFTLNMVNILLCNNMLSLMKIGPIVRAWPDQLHIYDLEAYNQWVRPAVARYLNLTWNGRIFKAGNRFPKERCFYTCYTPLNGSFFSIQDNKDAMARKVLISPYLSLESIRRAEPLVQTLCSRFLRILQVAASDEEGGIANLSMGFRALASDTIMSFTFSKPLGGLDSPGFQFNVTKALNDGVVVGQWSAYFPRSFRVLFQVIDMLPSRFIDNYMAPLALTKLLLRVSSLRSMLPVLAINIANKRCRENEF